MRFPAALLALLVCFPAVALAAEPAPEEAGGVDFSFDPLDLRGPTFRFWGGELHLGGRFALDAVAYGSDNVRDDGLEIEDARLTIEGAFDRLALRLEPDFKSENSRRHLFEAWGEYGFCPEFRVRAGQFRVAFTSDFGTRGETLPYPGYDFLSMLTGRHDIGLAVDGDLFGERLWYGLFATAGSGFGVAGQDAESPLLAGRIFARPFGGVESEFPGFLRAIYLGGALAEFSDFDDTVELETPLGNHIFRSMELDGSSGSLIAFEAGIAWGPVRFGYEHAVVSVDGVPLDGDEEDLDDFLAFGWQFAWNVTGEDQAWSRGGWAVPDPETKAEWAECFPGRLELGISWSNGDMDRNVILGELTRDGVESDETEVWQVFLSWYPNPRTRIGIGFVHTAAQEELQSIGGTSAMKAFGGDDSDLSFVLRIEHVF